MSMLPYLFDNDWRQRADIESLRSEIGAANMQHDLVKFSEAQTNERLEQMEGRIGRLNLLVAALVRVLTTRQIVTTPELTELIRQIDLEDGQEDGQLNEPRPKVPQWCTKCEARITPGKTYCMFCGKRYDQNPQDNQHASQ